MVQPYWLSRMGCDRKNKVTWKLELTVLEPTMKRYQAVRFPLENSNLSSSCAGLEMYLGEEYLTAVDSAFDVPCH